MEAEASQVEPRKRKRRWYQFSLRSLLILTLVCALISAWIANWAANERKRQQAIDALVSTGAMVRFDYQNLSPHGTPAGPAWLRSFFGENAFSDLTHVIYVGESEIIQGGGSKVDDNALQNLRLVPSIKTFVLLSTPKVTDRGIANVTYLSQLSSLTIQGTQASDAALECVADLRGIRELRIAANKISDRGIQHLKRMAHLQLLSLDEAGTSDSGLATLAALTELKSLTLYGEQFTDDGVSHLAGLTNLEELCLMRTQVTDAGIEKLRYLTKLRILVLPYTNVTDSGVRTIARFSQLKTLGLMGTKITNASAARIKALTQLKNLNVDHTPMTDNGIAEIQNALPQCKIVEITH